MVVGSHPRHAAPARPRIISGWALAGVAGAGLVALLTYLMLPSAHLVRGGPGIARLSAGGLQSELVGAAFASRGRSVPLSLKGSVLVPRAKLSPGTSGTVVARVQGPAFLHFLPWDTQTVRLAASAPLLPPVAQHITRPLRPGLTLKLAEPVTGLRYQVPGGIVRTLRWQGPRSTVTLPLSAPAPGLKGSLTLWVKARSWESYGTATSVSWSTVPSIAASTPQSSISPTGPLTVTFSQPIVTSNLSQWKVAPSIAGTWRQVSATEFAFTPSAPDGLGPGALAEVTIPSGSQGPQSITGSVLASPAVIKWTTPPGSVLRLQQLLAEEGYLPVTWTATRATANPTTSSEDSTIYNPPAGRFKWAYPNLPSTLASLWVPGQMSVVTKGAIMQFEAANGLPVDGIAGPDVWRTLIADRLAGRMSPHPYTYISVTETRPETLEVWVGNHLFLTTKTNTGIPATPTYLGTFPIYERLKFQIMRGKNPNGVKYADPVYWINYFHGGDAVHGFVRASYGFPQSLGCVEVPPPVSQTIFSTVHYGTLVTVNPVGIAPAPAHATP